jgi:DNA-binding transcriptional MocR family regulator
LTHGANHAFDLIIRQYLEPGDTVFVDAPGYSPLFAKLALSKVQIVGIRRNPDGPDLEDMALKLVTLRPKLFFTQSQAHNPTGGSLSAAKAFGLLQAADKFGFRLVEDDTFADVLPSSAPRLAAFDQLERVLYVGSFSKTLSASLRSGFIAGHPLPIGALSDLKMVTTVATSDFVERFIFGLIQGGHYLRHLRRLRVRLEGARERVLPALSATGLKVTCSRNSGFYLWAELPPGMDEHEFCRKAASEGIFVAPGDVFYPDRATERGPSTRINVAYGADIKFLRFVQEAVDGSQK